LVTVISSSLFHWEERSHNGLLANGAGYLLIRTESTASGATKAAKGASVKGKPRSIRQAQAIQAARMREQGRSWAEIGVAFQAVYRVNPRVALRQAHGWSQPQAAERWTALWPEDPKTFKNFSYWEQWPGRTGHSPSLDTLDRLARLYECKVTDLLTDCRDYGTKPTAVTAPPTREITASVGETAEASAPITEPGSARPADLRSAAFAGPGASGSAPVPAAVAQASTEIPAISASTLHAALEVIKRAEANEPAGDGADSEESARRLRRRNLLLEASSALAVVAAAPVLEVPRVAGAARPWRGQTDASIVNFTGEVVGGLRRLGGAVGPRITLQPAMALRSAMAALARNMPEIVTGQALTAYGDLTQLIGWLMFNLGDHKAARYYYDDARAAGYRAGNNDLVAYTLSAASQLAAVRHRPRQAVDHAQAALHAAKSSGSPYALAYAADVLARAYAAAGRVGRCRGALDKEREALGLITDDTPRSPWWYFYDRSFYWGTECECAIRLNMPVDACDAASRSLGLVAPLNLHNSALTLAFRAEALIKQHEYDEACVALADSARLTTLNSSHRIARRVDLLRRQLRVVDDTPAVRELDEKLQEYRRARVASDPPDLAPADTAGVR
jgi:tetratricopeptide (TPR) repeat protein